MRLRKPNQELPLAAPVDSGGSDQLAHREATCRPFDGNRRLLKILTVILCFGLFCLPAIAPAQSVMAIPDDTVVTLQRGNCEVTECPVYRVVIFADGDVIWQGRGRVAKRGVVLSRIERDRIRALLQDFAAIDYFHLDDIYGFNGSGCRSMAPYTPTVITSLSMGGLSKILSHHDGCVGEVSEKLKALENSIDKAANTARWISGEPPASKH
jgi:Domain of unknown function (DUF6438)